MRIVFMGSPDFAVPSLDALVEAGHEVVAVYRSRRGRPGAARRERKTAVHERAEAARDRGAHAADAARRGRAGAVSRRWTPMSRWSRPMG